jgi:hypothetical protein
MFGRMLTRIVLKSPLQRNFSRKSSTARSEILRGDSLKYWGVRTTKYSLTSPNGGSKFTAVVLLEKPGEPMKTVGIARAATLGSDGDSPLPESRQGAGRELGLAGYGQWQTTDKRGPTITPQQAAAHYKVNGLGFAANALFPGRKASVGVKYFHEFACRSTYQGYKLQISGAITF